MSFLVILGAILVVMGILFCVLPVLPGPLMSYAALILLSIRFEWEIFSPAFLIVMGVVTVLVSVLDNVLPVLTSRKAGATKAGIWGAVIGMAGGMFVLPPFGMFIGTLVGAVAGELLFNPRGKNALQAGWGVFWGTILGIGLKLAVSSYIAWVFIRTVF